MVIPGCPIIYPIPAVNDTFGVTIPYDLTHANIGLEGTLFVPSFLVIAE